MIRLIPLLFMISACAPSSIAAISPEDAQLSAALTLEKTSTLDFYFVSQTGEYDFDEQDIISNSSIRVTRDCGNNCAMFMAPILEHLRNSVLTDCENGQQDILIRWGDNVSLVYSYSGRLIKFDQTCYFNENSIDEVLKRAEFFFR